jgi:hypothetical protein
VFWDGESTTHFAFADCYRVVAQETITDLVGF